MIGCDTDVAGDLNEVDSFNRLKLLVGLWLVLNGILSVVVTSLISFIQSFWRESENYWFVSMHSTNIEPKTSYCRSPAETTTCEGGFVHMYKYLLVHIFDWDSTTDIAHQSSP